MKKNRLFLLTLVLFIFNGIGGNALAQGSKKDLKTRVEDALSYYYMHLLDVRVDDGGVVTVKGVVDALYDRLDIYKIVSQVQGVTYIKYFVTG